MKKNTQYKFIPYRGDIFFSTKIKTGCQAISKNSGRLCNNGDIVSFCGDEIKLCAHHAGMLMAGYVHGKEGKMAETEYVPIQGFYDLREYDLPKKIFQKLWNIQEYLNHVNERREYFKVHNPIMWRKAQELSADYQRVLFAYDKKPVQMDLIVAGT